MSIRQRRDSPDAQTLLLDALAVRLRLSIEDPSLAETMHHLLGDLRPADCPDEDISETGHGLRVMVSGVGPWLIQSPGHDCVEHVRSGAVSAIMAAVNRAAVASTPWLALHAAVVSRGTSAVVVPGRSGRGKTTLAACLLARGWDYVSDEALALGWSDSQIHAYPRPLALSAWAADLLGVSGVAGADEVIVRPRDLGARPVSGNALNVTHIVTLQRDEGRPRLEPLHRADALSELLQRGFTHRDQPALALRVIAALTAQSACWQLRLGDPREAADLITDQFENPRPVSALAAAPPAGPG